MTGRLATGAVATRLFADHVRPAGPPAPTASVSAAVEPGTPTRALLLAAVAVTLWRHAGDERVCLAELSAGRPLTRVGVSVDPAGTAEELTAAAGASLATAEPWPTSDGAPGVLVADATPDHGVPTGAGLADVVVTTGAEQVRMHYDPRVYLPTAATAFVDDVAAAARALAAGTAPADVWPSPPVDDGPAGSTPDPPTPDLVQVRADAWPDPDAVALAGGGRRIDARNLAGLIARTAALLAARRVAGRVAVLADHDIDGPVAVWSVLAAGAAYVPIDPRQPDARLGRIVADAEVTAVLCPEQLVGRARRIARRVPVIGFSSIASDDVADTPAFRAPGPDEPAYLLHTSGTTGRPKAIVQSRRNVLEHARVYAGSIDMTPADRVALLAPITFDAAVMDLFGSAVVGASLHVIDPLQPASALLAELAEHRVTVLHGTPSLLRHLLSAARPAGLVWAPRAVVLGGEAVGPDDARRLREWFPEAVLVNGLGPSECTMALQHRIDDFDTRAAGVPVGRPVPGLGVELVDPAGRRVGVVGELVLVSDRVATGYWGQPELTSGAFTTGDDGRRRYRTGDVVRRRADGDLVFVGRRDRQVKIRGHRVEPAEIEAVLRSHPTVAQAAVVPVAEPEPRLVAYATPSTVFAVSSPELREFLTRQLPGYAVPAVIVPLDAMPLGPTGKLDRARLPAPPEAPEAGDAGRELGATEQLVAQVWADVLRVAGIDPDADFLANGGDSLSMMAMLDEVAERLGVTVDLADFLADPSVSMIVAAVDTAAHAPQEA